jgi:hypothetical protein
MNLHKTGSAPSIGHSGAIEFMILGEGLLPFSGRTFFALLDIRLVRA